MTTPQNAPNNHVPETRNPTDGMFVGACSCGWAGADRDQPSDASQDAAEHVSSHIHLNDLPLTDALDYNESMKGVKRAYNHPSPAPSQHDIHSGTHRRPRLGQMDRGAGNREYQCPGCWSLVSMPALPSGYECECGEQLICIDLRADTAAGHDRNDNSTQRTSEVIFVDADGNKFVVSVQDPTTKDEAIATARQKAKEFVAAGCWQSRGPLTVWTVNTL